MWWRPRGHKWRHNMAHTRFMLHAHAPVYPHARTHRPISNIYCFSTTTVMRERASMLRYTYIACLVRTLKILTKKSVTFSCTVCVVVCVLTLLLPSLTSRVSGLKKVFCFIFRWVPQAEFDILGLVSDDFLSPKYLCDLVLDFTVIEAAIVASRILVLMCETSLLKQNIC